MARKSRGGRQKGRKKVSAKKASVVRGGQRKPLRGSKPPKLNVKRSVPRDIKKRIVKHGQAVEYLGGEKTLRKGTHKIVESGPLTIGKRGIAVVRSMVLALEKLPPSTKLSYNLEVRFNDKDGIRRSVTTENIALPILKNIRVTKRQKKKGMTAKDRWINIVYGTLRKRIFEPIIAEFGFVSGKRVPTHKITDDGKKVRIRNRAEIVKQIEAFREQQDTRFKLTLQREVF